MAELTKQSLQAASPQSAWDLLRALGLGDLVRQSVNQQLRQAVPVADPSQLATVQSVGVDLGTAPSAIANTVGSSPAAAASIMRAVSRAGANAGELAVVAYGTTPATGQVAVAPNGNIVVLAADAHTSVDVDYAPMKGDYLLIPSLNVSAATGIGQLPASVTNQGALLLLSATALSSTSGSNLGAFKVLKAGTAATTLSASLNITKANVVFLTADTVLTAKVELLLASSKNVDALLRGASIAV
jgi:hypothetical protein